MAAIDDWLEKELYSLQGAYQAGCLGALNDVLFYCNNHSAALPDWAAKELHLQMKAVFKGDKEYLNKWSAWSRRYKKDIQDYGLYEAVQQAREHGAEWDDVYDIAASIEHNRVNTSQKETVKKAYKRVLARLKVEPFRYKILRSVRVHSYVQQHKPDVWKFINETIDAGSPKKKKTDLG